MTTADKPRRRNRIRPLAALLAFALVVGSGIAWWIWSIYSGSLPDLDSRQTVQGISADIRIDRDAQGIPTISANNRRDLAFATGYVHGQDRFFQMDLLRRHPAGELSALVGPGAVSEDKRMRLHRFRHRARREMERLPASERALMSAYAAGVEAGRRSLKKKPWEYVVLQVEPEPWKEEDIGLVVFAMYVMLQGSNVHRERAQGLVEELLPAPLARFLSPAGSLWDAPLVGEPFPCVPVPSPEEIDLRKNPSRWQPRPKPGLPEPVLPGSNNWAVDARRSAHGGAIIACDLHLGLMVPMIWYRASFEYEGNKITGATLPGTPATVIGSNGRIAWGFTNVEADSSDQIILMSDPKRPDCYLTPKGWQALEKHTERIQVKGGPSVEMVVEESIWGPVLYRDHNAKRVALRWVAHEPGGINLELMRLETATSVREALMIAPRCGSPTQNLVVADHKGHIGWTVLGRLPNRIGFDGRTPARWDDGSRRWEGFLESSEYPRLFNPPAGRIWTANNRTVPEPDLSRLGLGVYDHGARAKQIRDGLMSLEKASESDMLAIQLDDRALFLSRWQRLMVGVLSSDAARADERRESMRREVLYWGGRASVDSVGYRLVKQFRAEVVQAVLMPLTAPCLAADPRFSIHQLESNVEQSVWLLVTEKPQHLLPPGHPAWETLLLGCVDRVADTVKVKGTFEESLRAHTWGEANRARLRHPLSAGLGRLARWLNLDMPDEPLPGDSRGMPRIHQPGFGASQRMAVSPGREEEGYFHMPAGQSGHPLSTHYRDGHADWVAGRPSPFLPGPRVSTLVLTPG